MGAKKSSTGPARQRAASSGRSNGQPKEPLISVPDVLGDAGRARLVAQMLERLQMDKANVELMRIGNGHEESDEIRGMTGQDGKPVTYGERVTQLQESEERIVAAHSEIMDEVEKFLEQIRQQQKGA